MRHNARGQSTAEYAILIAVVIAAVVGMQLYVKRGMQGKFRDVSDAYTAVSGDIGGDAGPVGIVLGTTQQYEPYYTAAGALTTISTNTEGSQMAVGGRTTKTGISNTTTRTGTQTQGVTLTDDDAWE